MEITDKTVYVVSGYMRTGTSMVMKALETGGMTACYKQSRDAMKNRFADEHYDPNIGGLYELSPKDYQSPNFPNSYKGKVIKGLNYCVPRMRVMPDGIRVVFMMRDKEEVLQSYDAFFGKRLKNINKLEANMQDVIARIQNRKDVLSIDVFWYRKVVENPFLHFDILRAHGWPIDASKAANIVDEKLCRYRIERLTVGIV